MSLDLAALGAALARGPLVRVVVAAAQGSAPREPGAAMLVQTAGRVASNQCRSTGSVGKRHHPFW